MGARLAEAIKYNCTHAPIWCWQSCNGEHGASPTVGTAKALLSEFQLDQGMISVEMDVPGGFVLLSSYYAWSRFLDRVIVRRRVPVGDRIAGWMFQQPLLKHPTDDIQAVIPYIDSTWVIGTHALRIDGRSWDEPIAAG